MKLRHISIAISILIALASCTAGRTVKAEHPYLLMNAEKEAQVRTAVQEDSIWARYHENLIKGADEALCLPPCIKKHSGKKQKLLAVSREFMRRILLWGYAYRMTGEAKYAERGIAEMLNVCAFPDWNPKHFLDTGEMTSAMAIGYDWYFDILTDEQKTIIRQAIVDKGILPSKDSTFNNWLRRENNWNQVCNGSMTLGALAVRDKYPGLAEEIVKRSVESVKIPMHKYGPDGAYPEGYMYWGYGTTYNILMLDALVSVYGHDFGLSEIPGFIDTGSFLCNMVMGDGWAFNYGDCENKGRMNPGVFWFAQKKSDPSILWSEKHFLDKKGVENSSRFATMIIIWGSSIRWDSLQEPSSTIWATKNATIPVALMRNSWKFGHGQSVAFKGGTAQSGHPHLDAGSFVYTDGLTRWAIDLGPQNYNSLDVAGLDQWNKSQDSERWKVFRYNNMAHNTLTFDGQLQNALGHAPIIGYGEDEGTSYATADLSEIYCHQMSSVTRTVTLHKDGKLSITDRMKTSDEPRTLRWNMATTAEPETIGPDTITLKEDGKTLIMDITGDVSVRTRTWSARSSNSWDAPNPGVIFVGYEAELAPHTEYTFTTVLHK